MKALSTRNDDPTRASRPWDSDRDGFVLGDGAGILVLEEYEHAKARGARIYCELAGFGASSDAFHMTAPSENGDGPARCMAMAIKRRAASMPTRSNTSTRTAPRRRSATSPKRMAIKRALGDHAYKTMVSSTKSMTGHLLGAAGGVEAIFSVLALHTRRHSADDQPRESGRRLRPRLRAERRRARRRSTSRCRTASASAAPTARWCSAASERASPQQRARARSRITQLARATSTCWRCTGRRRRAIRCCSNSVARRPRRGAGTCCSPTAVEPAAGSPMASRATRTATPLDGDFLSALDARLARRSASPRDEPRWPFRGGWALFLGYELAAQVEPVLRLAAGAGPRAGGAGAALPGGRAARPATAASASRSRKPGTRHGSTRIVADVAAPRPRCRRCREWQRAASIDEDEPAALHSTASRACIEYLAAGDVFQVNLSRGWRRGSTRRCRPGGAACAPARRESGAVRRPVRGDRTGRSSVPRRSGWCRCAAMRSRRARSPARARASPGDDDAARIRELVGHPKERAEHVMLIDLERNDLGRVCAPGSVEVDELMTVESYAHVHHIVSNVRGRLRADATPGDVIRAVFPGGTITGCPKVRCMQIIAELEGQGRGAVHRRVRLAEPRRRPRPQHPHPQRRSWKATRCASARARASSSTRCRSASSTKPAPRRAACCARWAQANERARSFIGDARIDALPGDAIAASRTATACSKPCACITGTVPWWDAHRARLAQAPSACGCRLPERDGDRAARSPSCSTTRRDGVAKLIVTRGGGGRGYAPAVDAPPVVAAVAPSLRRRRRAQAACILRWCDDRARAATRAGRHQALQSPRTGARPRRMARPRRSTKA